MRGAGTEKGHQESSMKHSMHRGQYIHVQSYTNKMKSKQGKVQPRTGRPSTWGPQKLPQTLNFLRP